METSSAPLPLHLDYANRTNLSEAAKWAKFLAILGFIMCGILFIMAFFIGSILTAISGIGNLSGMGELEGSPGPSFFQGATLTIFYILIALLYVLPCLFLYRFADKMQTAIKTEDPTALNLSFQNLKSLFKFMGILTIVVLSFYFLVILVSVIALASVF